MIYKVPKIEKFCFIDRLTRKSTSIPTPAPAESPAVSAPKLKLPDTNSWDSTTLAAQFGISPIRAATKGCTTLFVRICG